MLLDKSTRISTTQLATWEHTNAATKGTYFLYSSEIAGGSILGNLV
jgi:hypothetical protein